MDDADDRLSPDRAYAFGDFVLHVRERRLTREGRDVAVTPRVLDVLVHLVEHAGELVTKANLLDAVWGRIVVEEGSLTQAVHELRRVLGDSPRERRYVSTVPGRGYRFVAAVREHAAVARTAAAAAPAARATARRPAFAGAALLVAAAWVVAAAVLIPSTMGVTRPTAQADALAAEARFFLGRRGPADLERAEAAARAAVESDPRSAQAWSALAGVHAIRAGTTVQDQADAEVEHMRRAAERALRLDPNNGAALVRMSMYHWTHGDVASAERFLAAASAAAPGDTLALAMRAGLESSRGRFAEAVRLQREAVRHDPVNAIERANLAAYLYLSGRLDEARREYHAAIDLAGAPADSELVRESAALAVGIDVAAGRLDEARRVLDWLPAGLEREYCEALLATAEGDDEASDAAVAQMHARATDADAFLLAEVHAWRGELDAAFHWLDVRRSALGDGASVDADAARDVVVSPLMTRLRDDPRWQRLTAVTGTGGRRA